jgi:triosephosphate isomerase
VSRTPVIAANWKMHKTPAEAAAFVRALAPRVRGEVEVIVCPTFLALAAASEAAQGTGIRVFAQNMHEADSGAFTGEVSAPMLADLVQGVLLGHSERRQYFGETDRALRQKVPAAFAAGLVPLLCVGETEEDREAGSTERKLRHQVQEALGEVERERLGEVIVAYEPVWAIGTGLTATPEQAQETIGFIRALVADLHKPAGDAVRVLYGGSLKPDNAAELLALPDVDGALVGGASLDPEPFAAILEATPAPVR